MSKTITGNDMANFLENYAEIGFKYVTKIKDMIKTNKLGQYNNTKLIPF